MKKFFNAGSTLLSFDTDTDLLSDLGNRYFSDRVDYTFVIEESGEFICGKSKLQVNSGDVVAVLYANDDSNSRIATLYGSKEHIDYMNEYVEIRKKRDAEQEFHHKCSNSEDCCNASSDC